MIPILAPHDASPGAYAALTAGFAMGGTLVSQVSPWLQNGAYCVSIAVGICALIKFWRDRK